MRKGVSWQQQLKKNIIIRLPGSWTTLEICHWSVRRHCRLSCPLIGVPHTWSSSATAESFPRLSSLWVAHVDVIAQCCGSGNWESLNIWPVSAPRHFKTLWDEAARGTMAVAIYAYVGWKTEVALNLDWYPIIKRRYWCQSIRCNVMIQKMEQNSQQ